VYAQAGIKGGKYKKNFRMAKLLLGDKGLNEDAKGYLNNDAFAF